jgi:hypothetical protein
MPHTHKGECAHAHDRVEIAAADLAKKQQEHSVGSREARHGTRNIRTILGALLDRLERGNANRD